MLLFDERYVQKVTCLYKTTTETDNSLRSRDKEFKQKRPLELSR